MNQKDIPRQIPLALRLSAPPAFGNFVTGANGEALAAVRAMCAVNQVAGPGSLPSAGVILCGPPGSGKSHLLLAATRAAEALASGVPGIRLRPARYFSLAELGADAAEGLADLAGSGLLCLDDLDRVMGDRSVEVAVMRLLDVMHACGGRVLIAMRALPARGDCGNWLPDLVTRLQLCLRFELAVLGDADKRVALTLRAAELGFGVEDDVLQFILARHARDMHALSALLERLDRGSLVSQRRVTIPLVQALMRGEAPS